MPKEKTIRPFRAIRYNPEKITEIDRVIAPPYDVISEADQDALYNKSPYNIVRLDLTRDEGNQAGFDRYAKAAQDFTAWQKEEVLMRDAVPALYVYEQEFSAPDGTPTVRRGFYALRRLERFGEGRVFPHERTLSGPKKDRLSLMKATHANLSPIFGLFHDPNAQTAGLLEDAVSTAPALDFQDSQGQRHRLWCLNDAERIDAIEQSLHDQIFLIADGHHRYETALNYEQWCQANNGNDDPDASHHYVLMFCEPMSDPGLLVLPTHRLVLNRQNFSRETFLAKLRQYFTVEECAEQSAEEWEKSLGRHSESTCAFGIVFHDISTCYEVTLDKQQSKTIPMLQSVAEPLRSLDAAILHKVLLEGFLDYSEQDQENTALINYVKSGEDLLKRCKQTPANVGILMNAPSLHQIATIAEAGQIMPPKTTYFYPKLPTGLLINLID